MITIFNRKMILRTFDLDKYLNARDALVETNVYYKTIIRRRRNPEIFAGRKLIGEYNMYVHEEDYNKAIAVINRKDGFL